MTETLVRYEDPAPGVARIVLARAEPPRDCRRPFGLSYAAMGASSSMA